MSHHGRPPEAAPSAFYKDPTTGYVYIDDELYVPANEAVIGLYDDRGEYDASGNTYPASGGSGTAGAILRGDAWTATDDGGTLNGIDIEENDLIVAKVDSPGQTAANWNINKATGGSGGGSFDLPAAIHAATGKTTPVDADEIGAADSAASFGLKKFTWANIKATLKTYFDTLYPSGSGTSSGTNTGDQILPVKATGAETDIGTDDAKFVTPKALADSDYIKSSQVPAEIGIVESVVAGSGVDVDNADPANPVVSANGETGITPNTIYKAGAAGEPVASQIGDDGTTVSFPGGAFFDDTNSTFGNNQAVITSDNISSVGLGDVQGTGNGTSIFIDDNLQFISMSNVPTSDPHVAGRLYTMAGVLNISAG